MLVTVKCGCHLRSNLPVMLAASAANHLSSLATFRVVDDLKEGNIKVAGAKIVVVLASPATVKGAPSHLLIANAT